MKSSSIFSFLRHNKNRFKPLEDQLPMAAPNRTSAWSYSYDLHLNERWEAAMNLEENSSDSETVANYYISRSNLNPHEDLHNDVIFQTSHQELASKEQLLTPPKDENLHNLKLLRLSDVQKQSSWLERIASPFHNDATGDVKPANKRRCKSQIDIPVEDYLWRFIHKTALPLIQEYEQLRKRYSREKKEWLKHIEFLERQISVGRSMWRDVDQAYRDSVKEVLSLQKTLSQTIGMEGNFKAYDPVPSERRRTHNWSTEAKVIPELQNTLETGHIVNEKPDAHRVDYLELKRKVIEYEDLIFSEHSQNINETNIVPVAQNLWPKLLEPLQRKLVSGESKNTIVPDSSKNLNGNTFSVTVNSEKLLVPDIAEGSSAENSTLSEELDVDRRRVMFSAKPSGDLKVGGGKTAKNEVTDYENNINEQSIDSWSKQDKHKLKEKSSSKTGFIDPHVLKLCDSWYLKSQDETISSRGRRVILEYREKSFIDSLDMSKSRTYQTLDSIRRYQREDEIFNKNISRIAIRSKWL